jgi:hypothetical protein
VTARRVRQAVLACSLLALLATSVASAGVTKRLEIPTAGASIAVPTAWKALDASVVTSSKEFARFIDQNPSLRPFVEQMRGPGSTIKLMVFDLKLTRGFATNVNVVVGSGSAGVTLAQLESLYKQQLRTLLPTLQGPVTTSVVSLPSGKAVRASYRIGFETAGRTLTVQSLQYVVLRANKSIVLTFSTLPTQARARGATFTAIARSLRFD